MLLRFQYKRVAFVQKKAGLHCCCSAIRGSRIAFVSEQATPKSTLICTHAHTPIYSVYGYGYTYPEDIKMLQCVGYYVEICEISNSQAQSADDALLLCPESHDWGLLSNLLPKFGDNFGFPRGDISHPLNPALDFRLQNYNISLNNARK